jgi:serine/threonine-protein kinase
MGTVFAAEHVQVRRRFALKFLRPDRNSTPRYLRRFEREAELLGRLDHENVVGLHDIGVDPQSGPYLVLEYVRGVTLRYELDCHGVRPIERLAPILRQVARGLAHAHALGIVHRDLKPENVMLTEHGDGRLLVKLLDFGVAGLRDDDAERMTLSDTALGTAAYMAPEQARGDRALDARTDIFALGVIAYEALSGTRPYLGSSYNETLFKILHRKHRPLAELRPDLPSFVTDAVERALSKDVEARFPAVEDFVQRIDLGTPHEARSSVSLSMTSTVEGETLASVEQPMKRRSPMRAAGLGLGATLVFASGWLGANAIGTSRLGREVESAPAAAPEARGVAHPAAPARQVFERPAQASVPALVSPAAERSGPAAVPAAKKGVRGRPVQKAPATGDSAAAVDLHERGYILENPYPRASASTGALRR